MKIDNRLGLTESVETLIAQGRRMAQVSNNLANVNTAGFKKQDQTFWEILFRTQGNRSRVGKAVRDVIDHSQGSLKQTGNPLDLAIEGDGFFRIQTPGGVRYSRAGNFTLDAQGQLSTMNGYPVLGDGGPVTIEGTEVSIGLDGRVVVDGVDIGLLSVVRFPDPELLEKEGGNLFRATTEPAPEEAAEEARVRQGYTEASNVNSVAEMTAMIDLLRAFELQQKAVRAVDGLDNQAINRVGILT